MVYVRTRMYAPNICLKGFRKSLPTQIILAATTPDTHSSKKQVAQFIFFCDLLASRERDEKTQQR